MVTPRSESAIAMLSLKVTPLDVGLNQLSKLFKRRVRQGFDDGKCLVKNFPYTLGAGF